MHPFPIFLGLGSKGKNKVEGECGEEMETAADPSSFLFAPFPPSSFPGEVAGVRVTGPFHLLPATPRTGKGPLERGLLSKHQGMNRATKTIRHTKHFSIIAQLMHFVKTAHLYSSRRLRAQWSETLCVLLLLSHDTAQTSRVCTECSVRERPRRRPHEKSGGAEIGGLSSLPPSSYYFLCDKSPPHGSP